MTEVLIVNSNSDITKKIQRALGNSFHCTSVQSTEEAKTLLKNIHFNALILDFKECIGSDLFKDQKIPVFVVSNKNSSSDRILALSLGILDFIDIPFHPDELKARISVKLKYINQAKQSVFRRGSITADYETHVLKIKEHVTGLTHIEFKVFMKLFKNPGRPVTRKEISEGINIKGVDKGSRKVDAHISNLRRKLGHYDRVIGSVYGRGYIFRENFL